MTHSLKYFTGSSSVITYYLHLVSKYCCLKWQEDVVVPEYFSTDEIVANKIINK